MYGSAIFRGSTTGAASLGMPMHAIGNEKRPAPYTQRHSGSIVWRHFGGISRSLLDQLGSLMHDCSENAARSYLPKQATLGFEFSAAPSQAAQNRACI